MRASRPPLGTLHLLTFGREQAKTMDIRERIETVTAPETVVCAGRDRSR
jgi:hypothetical protein